MNPLFVGIDVSSKNNVVYLMKPDGTKFSAFSVQNNLGGARILSERIVSALDKLRLSEVTIGMEATSIYGDSLVYALREDGSLGRYQRHIHVLNPKQVRKFKDAYPDLPKNDYVDAFVIADLSDSAELLRGSICFFENYVEIFITSFLLLLNGQWPFRYRAYDIHSTWC